MPAGALSSPCEREDVSIVVQYHYHHQHHPYHASQGHSTELAVEQGQQAEAHWCKTITIIGLCNVGNTEPVATIQDAMTGSSADLSSVLDELDEKVVAG